MALLTTAGVFGVFQPGGAFDERRSADDASQINRQILDTLGDVIEECLFAIAQSDRNEVLEPAIRLGRRRADDALPLVPSDFGLHIWRISRFRRRLLRLRAVRLTSSQTTRALRFRKGYGVVGQCWQRNDDVCEDLITRYEAVTCESEWSRLPAEQRMGLSYEDHLQVRDRGAILSIPIRGRRENHFRGCVSLDLPFGVELLRRQGVQRRIRGLAHYISEHQFRGL